MAGPIIFVAFQVFLFGITNAKCPVECNDAKIFAAGEMCDGVDCEGTWHLKDPESANCYQEWPVLSGNWVEVCKYRRNKDGKYMCFCDPGSCTYEPGQDWEGGLCFNSPLLTFLANIPLNSYAHCMAACIAANPFYTYFGLEDGNECFCGSAQPPTSDQVSQLKCDIYCPGSPLTTCGGTDAIQVYAIPKRLPDWEGGGCYDFSGSPPLTFLTNLPDNSYFACMDACITAAVTPAYTYFGLQDGNECFCGTAQPSTSAQVLQLDCSTPCPLSSPLTTCGGTNKMQIYAIPKP